MCRVLLADDEPVQLQLRRMAVEYGGHEVVAVCEPAAMLDQLDWADILIMDLRFPDAAIGLALIRRIRDLGLQLPVIVISGWPEELYGAPEERMVSRIMIKPTGAHELLAAIASLTGQ